MIKISVLVEDSSSEPSYENEKGLSLYIESFSRKVLFDTGMTNKYINNASKLGINLHKTEFVILSHGHNDHTGGFLRFIEDYGDDFTLIVRPELFRKKYKDDGTGIDFIGNSFNQEDIEYHDINVKYIKDGIEQITENLYVVSGFKKYSDFEQGNTKYVLQNKQGYEVDKFVDETILVADTIWGAVIISGCSHNGIVNIAKTVSEIMNRDIYAIVGGIHLYSESEENILNTIKELNVMNVKRVALCHCSGNKTIRLFNESFEGDVINLSSGTVIEL